MFFKIVQDKKIISVGSVFLKWNTKKHRLFICDVDEGQFVQSFDEQYTVRDTWMKVPPEDADEYPLATVIIITEQEYNDLKAILEDSAEIDIPEPVIEQQAEYVEPPEEEKVMSIAEMRQLILQQQDQINKLMQAVND